MPKDKWTKYNQEVARRAVQAQNAGNLEQLTTPQSAPAGRRRSASAITSSSVGATQPVGSLDDMGGTPIKPQQKLNPASQDFLNRIRQGVEGVRRLNAQEAAQAAAQGQEVNQDQFDPKFISFLQMMIDPNLQEELKKILPTRPGVFHQDQTEPTYGVNADDLEPGQSIEELIAERERQAANGSSLWGRPEGKENLPLYTPEQQQAMMQLLGHALPQLQSNQYNFEPIRQRAYKEFSEQGLPSLAQRFTNLGGRRGSGSFNRYSAQATGDLESQLAALESQYGQQRFGQLQNLAGLGLQRTFEPRIIEKAPGALERGLEPLLKYGLPVAAKFAKWYMNPVGAAAETATNVAGDAIKAATK